MDGYGKTAQHLPFFSVCPFHLCMIGGFILLALAGCAGRAPKVNREWQPAELHLRAAENYRQLQTFRGEANLAVESPQMQFSARGRILARKPDSLFIKVEAGFGIDAGFFFMDRQQFSSFAPMQNTYYYGETAEMREMILFGMELTYDEMISGMLGAALPPFDSSFTVTRDGETYRFEGRRRPQPDEAINTNGALEADKATTWQLAYWIDPERGVVAKIELRDEQDELYARQSFKRFRKVRGLWLPQLIQMERPAERERITIFYNRVEANIRLAPEEFVIRVPKNVKRIHLSDPAELQKLAKPLKEKQ